ncbi:2'-5'-oligoadenylate synthase 1-like [Gracilinanus agilis]|uniref:2'-5'-oligoadenylate synthase 1-like n=1 Tax=Gracilinanus agilis TaxID=191870 RepID=UPI001CFCF314|nr:2'-5'-oligoadenylate synthase 1-like [Gracilinanus agilis]
MAGELGLWYIPPKSLDKYIEDFLLPDTSFRIELKRAINIICSFLKERCFQDTWTPVRVTKVVKGGSSGKGTALRGRSDADLVVFLSNLRSYQDQIDRRSEFIKEIKKQLEACQREQRWMFEIKFEENKWSNPRVLGFRLKFPGISDSVDFDVLPAFDVLGQLSRDLRKPNPKVYIDLIKESSGRGGEFSTCFTELQKRFLKQRDTKLKSLIRLVKHWYKMCKEKVDSLPPQYALELLTIYAWEHGSKETYFNTAQGFRTVLYLIQQYQQLLVYWTVYYDFDNDIIGDYLRSQLQKPRPVILDPADPTGDVGGGSRWRWDRLAQQARMWLSAPCFEKMDGTRVEPWKVPVKQTPYGRDGFFLFHESIETFPTHSLSLQCNHHFHNELPKEEESYCTIL